MKQTAHLLFGAILYCTNAKAQTVLFNQPRVFVQSTSSPCCYAKDYHASLAVTDTILIDTSCCGKRDLQFTSYKDSATGFIIETGIPEAIRLAMKNDSTAEMSKYLKKTYLTVDKHQFRLTENFIAEGDTDGCCENYYLLEKLVNEKWIINRAYYPLQGEYIAPPNFRDCNNDGYLDLVVCDYPSDRIPDIIFFYDKESGTFAPAQEVPKHPIVIDSVKNVFINFYRTGSICQCELYIFKGAQRIVMYYIIDNYNENINTRRLYKVINGKKERLLRIYYNLDKQPDREKYWKLHYKKLLGW